MKRKGICDGVDSENRVESILCYANLLTGEIGVAVSSAKIISTPHNRLAFSISLFTPPFLFSFSLVFSFSQFGQHLAVKNLFTRVPYICIEKEKKRKRIFVPENNFFSLVAGSKTSFSTFVFLWQKSPCSRNTLLHPSSWNNRN